MKRMKRVVYVVENTQNAQFRYRVKNIAEAATKTGWNVDWVLETKLDEEDFSNVDLVVILRQTDKDGVIGRLIKRLHSIGVKVFFDLDDLVFDYRDLMVLMDSIGSKNVVYWLGYIMGIRRIAKKVDGFICTNEFLAGKLRRSFGKRVEVIRNSLNKEQVEVSKKCLSEKKHKGFVIGYFSGSPTHSKDLAMIEPDLVRFLKEHDNVTMMLVGYMKLSKEMQELVDLGRVERIKMVHFLDLQQLMARVDISIAPLRINDFTNCKSELKYFEAGIVETATIASPNYSFRMAIDNGKNGLLAKPDEWYDKIKFVYENPDGRREMALAAKKCALECYFGKQFLDEVEKVLNNLEGYAV